MFSNKAIYSAYVSKAGSMPNTFFKYGFVGPLIGKYFSGLILNKASVILAFATFLINNASAKSSSLILLLMALLKKFQSLILL